VTVTVTSRIVATFGIGFSKDVFLALIDESGKAMRIRLLVASSVFPALQPTSNQRPNTYCFCIERLSWGYDVNG